MPPRPRTLIIQTAAEPRPPAWTARCLASVKLWAAQRGHDYILTDQRAYSLCGEAYVARAGGDPRALLALARLELMRVAFEDDYERAAWIDAGVFVFDTDMLALPRTEQLTVGREAAILARRGDPEFDRLAVAVRDRAGDEGLLEGLRAWDAIGLVGPEAVLGLATNDEGAAEALAGLHGRAIYAARLDVGQLSEAHAQAAMDVLEQSRGAVVNRRLPPKVY